MDNRQEIYADSIENLGLEGVSCCIHHVKTVNGTESFAVRIPVAGQHMVYNAMAAAAAGAAMGLIAEQIQKGIESLETIAGRNHIIKKNGFLIIDDCYNANPVSMKASIDVINTAKGRKVCILGDMFELGADEKKLHYEVGEYLAKTNGNLHQDGYPCRIETFPTRDDLIVNLPNILEKGDNILIKASHGMEFGAVIEAITSMTGE